jgi:uncharacterized protein
VGAAAGGDAADAAHGAHRRDLRGPPAPAAGDRAWRLAFIAGLILAPVAAGLVGYPMASPQMPASWAIILGAGLLAGFGTRLGSGCTSGHGIRGIARLSARSLVATAATVVAVSRHVIGG